MDTSAVIAASTTTKSILEPVLFKTLPTGASSPILKSFLELELAHLTFPLDFVKLVLEKAKLENDVNEIVLRQHGKLKRNLDDKAYHSQNKQAVELLKKSVNLQEILCKIPDEIVDRRAFLETIKEIASSIKKLLDSLNIITSTIKDPSRKQHLEHRKREFVKYSKRFSNTLKDYFKEGKSSVVFAAATQLVLQTNLLSMSVNDVLRKA